MPPAVGRDDLFAKVCAIDSQTDTVVHAGWEGESDPFFPVAGDNEIPSYGFVAPSKIGRGPMLGVPVCAETP